MLYTAQSKLLPQAKNKVDVINSPEMETFLNEFNSTMAKNLGSSISKIIMQKYGRKIGRRQSQQLNYNISKSSNLIKSIHRSSNQQQRIENFRPNFTIYDGNRNKKMKRHTYNYRFSSSREENTDNAANCKDNSTKHKRSLVTAQVAKTQETMKRICIQKIMFQDDKEINVDQPQSLKSKEGVKKYSIQNKLMPIHFNPNMYEKPSLVELIKKYKFENLKTSNPPSTPKQPLHQLKKSQVFINAKFSPKKNDKCYKKVSNHYYYKTFKKKEGNKQSNRQSKQVTNDKKGYLKKMNSILSPWGTITDQYSVIETSA